MKTLHKVIWAEGMFLGQQHFQLWDRYFEDYQSLQSRSISPMAWGLLELEMDEEALENGQYRLNTCRAIFPDGRLVSYDIAEDDSLALDLTGGHAEKVDVFLCLPANRSASGINGYRQNGQLCAWRADYRRIGDENDPAREREVMLGRPNLMLLSSEDPRENLSWLKIAELVNDGDGRYAPVRQYVPPVTRIGASPHVHNMLQRLIELFSAKVRVLNERRRQLSAQVADFGHSDVSNFLVLQALSGAIPLLRHYRENPELHPEQLYQLLVRVIGSLCPFSFEIDVHSIPKYSHSNLTQVFAGVERQLRTLVDVAMPKQLAAVRLQKETDALYSVDNIESEMLRGSYLFLAVLSPSEDPVWVKKFERVVKVGARADIELVVASALPGVRLNHVQRPPSNLPIKSGYEYFRLEPRGEFWARIVQERTLGVFLSRDFARIRMEVVAVQKQR